MEWQPIETAPNDGETVVLGFYRINEDCHFINPVYFDGHFWLTFSYHGEGREFYVEPTHWMPIPEPPQAKEE
jgi:hypothetical protein